MENNVTEMNAGEVLKHHMKEYSLFTIEGLFPHTVDCLSKVYRRILITFENENKIQKLILWGGLVQQFHPHSDASIYQSIAKLMQEFRYQIPLLQHHGNSGSYTSPKGVAARYLKAGPTEFMIDIYFNTVKDALLKKFSESCNEMEIQYLIPKIPMSIYLHNLGIGTGYSSFTLPRDISNVCDLTVWYIDQFIAGKSEFIINNCFPKEICHLLLPMFPIKCNVLNKEELLTAYSKGDYDHRVHIEGDMHLNKSTITIKTIPFGTAFKTKVKPFIDSLKYKKKEVSQILDAMDTFYDNVDDEVSVDFSIVFKRNRSSWTHLEQLEKIFGIQSKLTPESRYITKGLDNQNLGPGQLLDIWFRERVRALMLKHSKEQEATFKKIHLLEGLLIIKDFHKEVIEIVSSAEGSDIYIKILMERFKLSMFQASQIGKLKIDDLNKTNRSNLPKEIAENRELLIIIKNNMLNIPQLIKEEVLEVKAKYGKKASKLTNYPEYIGYIQTEENGHIQIVNLQEILLYKDFDHLNVSVFPKVCYKYRYKTRDDGNTYVPDFPILFKKHFTTKYPFMHAPEKVTSTVVLNKADDNVTIFRVDGLHCVDDKDKLYTFCKNRVLSINEKGKVSFINVSSLPLRKNFNSLGNKTDTVHISNMIFSNLIIFYTNVNEPNTIRVSVIDKHNNQLNLLAGSEHLTKFHIFPFVDDKVVFKPDDAMFNRIKQDHVQIDNLVKFMDTAKFSIINLGNGTCSHNNKQKFKLTSFS